MLDDKDEFERFDPLGAIATDLGITRERMIAIVGETREEVQEAIRSAQDLPSPERILKINKNFNDLMKKKYGLVRRSLLTSPWFIA